MSNTTTKRQKAKASTKRDALASLRNRLAVLGAQETAADKDIARQLNALYHSRHAPPIIKHALFSIFYDLAAHYNVQLPKMFTSKWLPYWSIFVAVNRVQGHMPTSLRYTWQPTEEEEAQLDVEEKEEAETRGIFNLIQNTHVTTHVKDGLADILDLAHPWHVWEVFRVAWPIALEVVARKAKAEGSDQQ